MRKIIPIKKINAIFLTIGPIAGTIALSSPSFMIGAQAESEYYEMNNNYYKSEDSSITIDCSNVNINSNGLKSDAFTGSNVADGLNLLAQEGSISNSDNEDNEGISANSIINSDERNGQYKLDEDVVVKCIYNNVPCEVTVDTITGLGSSPNGIAYDSKNERMYTANFGGFDDNDVSVIDTKTNTVIKTITVGPAAFGIAHDPVKKRMYVTYDDNDVAVIDTATNTVIHTLTVGNGPTGIAYDPVNKRMYVTNFSDDSVSIIDTNSNLPSVIGTIPAVGDGPIGIAYDSKNKRMYVTNFSDDSVSVINTFSNAVIDSITVGDQPNGVAYDPVKKRMYVANQVSDTVSVIDTFSNNVIDTITVGDEPVGVAYDSVNKDIYVTNLESDNVSVIDTKTNEVIDTITVGDAPIAIAYDPKNKRMYTANGNSDDASVINICSIF